MRSDVKRDMDNGRQAFIELAWPVIGPLIGDGEFLSCEDDPGEIARHLDCNAGIDGLQVMPRAKGAKVRGVAVRMQPDLKSWDTFTIRALRSSGAQTELEKRLADLEEIEEAFLSPGLTIHGYYHKHEGHLIAVAAVKTRAFYEWVRTDLKKPKPKSWMRNNTHDDNQFFCVRWRDLEADGLTVVIARPKHIAPPALEMVDLPPSLPSAVITPEPAPLQRKGKGRRIHDLSEFIELWPAALVRFKKKIGITSVAYLHDALPVAMDEKDAVLEFKKEFHYAKACDAAKRLPFEQVLNECMAKPHRLVFRLAESQSVAPDFDEIAPILDDDDFDVDVSQTTTDVHKYAQTVFAAEVVGRSGT